MLARCRFASRLAYRRLHQCEARRQYAALATDDLHTMSSELSDSHAPNEPASVTAADSNAPTPVPPPPPSSRKIGGRELAIGALTGACLVAVSVATLRLPPPDAMPVVSEAASSLLAAGDSANQSASGNSTASATANVAPTAGNQRDTAKTNAGLAPSVAAQAKTQPQSPSTKTSTPPVAPVATPSGSPAAPSVATIAVSGMPADAELRIDGNVRSGKRLKVTPGRHILTVAFAGRVARTDTLTLTRDETRNWTPRLPATAARSEPTADSKRATPAKSGNASSKTARVSECDEQVKQQSWSDAFQACTKDAGNGSPSAKRQLALLYQQGKGVGRNDDLAAQWFGAGANGGDVEAMFQYASALERGRGIKKDQPAALRWYTQAGDAGNAAAQYAVGDAYDRGKLGVKKDKAQALRWFQMAAAQNFRDAADKVRNLSK